MGLSKDWGSRLLASFFLFAYIVVRFIWEVATFNITMSPFYCLLNLSVLMPLLILLLYVVSIGSVREPYTQALCLLSVVYLGGYLALGLTLYPLLLTPRIQPKSLFIDIVSLSTVTVTLAYTLLAWRSPTIRSP